MLLLGIPCSANAYQSSLCPAAAVEDLLQRRQLCHFVDLCCTSYMVSKKSEAKDIHKDFGISFFSDGTM